MQSTQYQKTSQTYSTISLERCSEINLKIYMSMVPYISRLCIWASNSIITTKVETFPHQKIECQTLKTTMKCKPVKTLILFRMLQKAINNNIKCHRKNTLPPFNNSKWWSNNKWCKLNRCNIWAKRTLMLTNTSKIS